MIEPKKKVSKARRNRRFSANAYAKNPTLAECPHCHTMKESHKMCPNCGFYNGRQIVAMNNDAK